MTPLASQSRGASTPTTDPPLATGRAGADVSRTPRVGGSPYRIAAAAPAPAGVTRVTHVLHDFDGGGLESLVARMAEALHPGATILSSVISLSGRVGRLGDASLRHFHRVVPLRPLRGVSLLAPTALAAAIRRTRADVVHLHSGVWYKGALAARMAGVPRVIFTEHGREHRDPPAARWLDRQAARLTDVVVPVSPRLETYLRETVGIPARQLRLVQNGVDTARYSPGSWPIRLAAELRIPRTAVVVGSVGRMEPVKGYDRLLHAFAAATAHTSQPDAVLVIFGDGGELPALRELATSLGIAERVRFPGWVATEPDVYRLFDIFALASFSEGLSLSLLEAMACGTVPVVNDVGANAVVLGPTLREQLVGAGDMRGLARRLQETIAQPERRAALRPLARAQAARHFGFDRMLAQYVDLYTQPAPRRGRGG